MCNVDSENLGNHNFNFNYLNFADMHQNAIQGTDKERIKYSQHHVLNAFYNVNFGGQECGLLFA